MPGRAVGERLEEPSGDRMTKTLRVATYNIRKAIGQDARRDPSGFSRSWRIWGRRWLCRRLTTASRGARRSSIPMRSASPPGSRRAHDARPQRSGMATAIPCLRRRGAGGGRRPHPSAWVGAAWRRAGRFRVGRPAASPRCGSISASFGIHRRRQADALVAAAEPENGHATIVLGDFNGWGRARYSLEPLERTLAGGALRRGASRRTAPRPPRPHLFRRAARARRLRRRPLARDADRVRPSAAVADFPDGCVGGAGGQGPAAAAIPRPRRLGELARP